MKNAARKTPAPKNQDTKTNNSIQQSKEELREAEIAMASEAAQKKKAQQQTAKVSEVVYRVKTKRDAGVLMAFITFNYRVFHPNVTTRMLFYGILILLPAFFLKITWLRILCLVLGALVILLALTRQYISLALTKSNDPDYKVGTDFTYDFTNNDASFYRNEEISSYSRYKDITGFYYDDDYYYLVLKNHEFHILPKDRFIKGNAADFEGFIYKKSHKTCKWIPVKFKDKLAKRRALRNMSR